MFTRVAYIPWPDDLFDVDGRRQHVADDELLDGDLDLCTNADKDVVSLPNDDAASLALTCYRRLAEFLPLSTDHRKKISFSSNNLLLS